MTVAVVHQPPSFLIPNGEDANAQFLELFRVHAPEPCMDKLGLLCRFWQALRGVVSVLHVLNPLLEAGHLKGGCGPKRIRPTVELRDQFFMGIYR